MHELRDKHPEQFEREFRQWAEAGPYDEWWDSVYEMAKEDGAALGFNIEDIHFTGFWSQGDGACWEGSITVLTFIEKFCDMNEPRWHILHALVDNDLTHKYVGVSTSGRYSHSNTMRIAGGDLDAYVDGEVLTAGVYAGADAGAMFDDIGGVEIFNELAERMEEEAKDFADQIYRNLEEEYEYLTSYEEFIASCEANDVEFEAEEDEVDC